jgi:Rps23 Pro-64 3,4-dihydroxylase Tpa1-like proline 4-hydroxylase
MKFTIVKEPLPFLIIDDVYDKEEQIKIYRELDFFYPKLLDAQETQSAKNIDGRFKSNKSIFLNQVFVKREFSDILNINRKIYSEEVRSELKKCCPSYSIMSNLNYDTTLLAYYGDGGNYFSHFDIAVVSSVTWFFKEPKNFTGGGFKFTESDIDVDVKNNRTVMFFSSFHHEVSEVNLIHKNEPGSGRFSITQFACMYPESLIK